MRLNKHDQKELQLNTSVIMNASPSDMHSFVVNTGMNYEHIIQLHVKIISTRF
ncbi:hypothetical protein Hanom_Chr14g01261241 [Helianthus anomalus]